MKAPTQFFHFDCFAVVRFELCSDETAVPEDTQANVLGFFLSRAQAAAYISTTEDERIAAHQRTNDARFAKFGWRFRTINAMVYQVVPLSQLSLEFLCQLENSLEKAAQLQCQGIGIEPADADAQLECIRGEIEQKLLYHKGALTDAWEAINSCGETASTADGMTADGIWYVDTLNRIISCIEKLQEAAQ